MENLNYTFNDKYCDIQSLVHTINLLPGKDLVGLELGIFKAQSFCTILSNCPNLKQLYGVDSFKPYVDFLADPPIIWDEKIVDFIKLTAIHNIKFCDNNHKAILIEEDSSKALEFFEESSLDFIFIDTYMTYEQAVIDLKEWYPKIKPGGLFAGHDWISPIIQTAVTEFRKNNDINSTMSCFDNVWCWIKN
jgi:hypothetical protein